MTEPAQKAPSTPSRPQAEGGVCGSYVAYLTDLERRVAALDGALAAVVALHSQHSDVGLADGAWCPADGEEYPCPTLRAALTTPTDEKTP